MGYIEIRIKDDETEIVINSFIVYSKQIDDALKIYPNDCVFNRNLKSQKEKIENLKNRLLGS